MVVERNMVARHVCWVFVDANLHENVVFVSKGLDCYKKELAANLVALVTIVVWPAGMVALVATNTHLRAVNLLGARILRRRNFSSFVVYTVGLSVRTQKTSEEKLSGMELVLEVLPAATKAGKILDSWPLPAFLDELTLFVGFDHVGEKTGNTGS